MKFGPILAILALAHADQTCFTLPTAGSLETTPYSVATTTLTTSGITEVAVLEHYRSITYVSSCDSSGESSSSTSIPSSSSSSSFTSLVSSSSSIGTTTIPVFK
ncbi:AGA2 (YGL032C) [Zygosaccharomyces parabailii]|nr:AGA2 (YGL032C) [Zygosaccharomyces parabailii]CDH08402.1 uncharacterized protein ZBAI_00184 [Zygosaccharomyces bailii ISA1307]SJM85871.1 uncharacterized protein ZBIST_2523 [Zygosaccharomyces bailii]